jgi:large subunit ribosomal protein L18
LIDDVNGVTLASANSRMKDIAAHAGNKVEKSAMVGKALAQKALSLGIENCIFDRGGYLYHGRKGSSLARTSQCGWGSISDDGVPQLLS